MDVFVSVGTGLNPAQEAFVGAVEDRLRAVGLAPCTIGRNTFSADAPLRAVTNLMDRCAGAVVIAVERYAFSQGVERRGTDREERLRGVALPTAWNQIEAAMAYTRGLPLLVLVDEQLRRDGLLEKGNDWYVQELPLDPTALNNPAFIGLLNNWRERVGQRQQQIPKPSKTTNPAEMSVSELIGSIKPSQFWAILVGMAGALAAAFALGAELVG